MSKLTDPHDFLKSIRQLESDLPAKPEYKKCFVAFLDILGFKEFMRVSKDDAPRLMLGLYREFRFVRAADYQFNTIEHRMFSDCVMIWCEHRNPQSIWNFLNQVELVREAILKHGFLVRGGVSYGDHFCSAEVVVSEGLIKAYKLEQSAIFPRVRIDDSILDLNDFKVTPVSTGAFIVPHGSLNLIVAPGKVRADTEGETCLCPFWQDSNLRLLVTGNTGIRLPGDAEYTPEQFQAFTSTGLQKLACSRESLLKFRSNLGQSPPTDVQVKVNYLIREHNSFVQRCQISELERASLMTP